ncbi:latrophilin receptor-like protein A [Saccostrea cucullata]|uniref:latrophilin receptor-like protein A n=1 Tax=Saccostrea cuccullata TaxID=36930 RepID=UPI002ED221FA
MEEENSVSFGQLLNTIAAINPQRLCRQDMLSESVRNLTTKREYLSYTKQFDRDKAERELLNLPAKLSAKFTAQGDEYISIDLKGLKFSNINNALRAQENILPDIQTYFVAGIHKYLDSSYPSTFVYVSNLLFCRQRTISKSKVKVDYNGQIIVKKTHETFNIGDFVLDFDNEYRVCVKSSHTEVVDYFYVVILETLTTVLNMISIVSLLILFVLYMLVPELRTLPGLNVMNTTFSLFCMQITYTVANVIRRSTLYCQIIGVILHYFWLTLCCCLFICSLHMYRTFSRYRRDSQIRGQNIRATFTSYVLFCYFTPLFVIATNIITTFALEGNIGYGKYLCFVENLIQNIVTFIVPLCVTCIVNTVLFIFTLLNISFAQNIRKTKENKSELLISIKLFSLTGTVWILQVLDSLLQISVFSFVVTFLTSLQGLFIFLSFSSSSRILNFLKSHLWKRNVYRNEDRESK